MSSKELKDLTADEVHATCASLKASITLSKEDACEFAGLMSSAFGQSCDTVKEQCMAAQQSDQDQAPEASCMPPTEQRAGCSATVAEYEVCLLAQTELIRTVTCASQLSTLETPLPECQTLTQKCPQLLGTDEGEGQGQGGENP